MRLGQRSLPALLAISLVGAPTAAQAAVAETARTASPVEGEQLADTGLAWAMAALIAVVIGILVFSDDDDEQPVSP